MKTANSKILCKGELDKSSVLHAYAHIPVEALKETAQALRERCDWYGRNDKNQYGLLYDCAIEVIKIVDPSFETRFIPAK